MFLGIVLGVMYHAKPIFVPILGLYSNSCRTNVIIMDVWHIFTTLLRIESAEKLWQTSLRDFFKLHFVLGRQL